MRDVAVSRWMSPAICRRYPVPSASVTTVSPPTAGPAASTVTSTPTASTATASTATASTAATATTAATQVSIDELLAAAVGAVPGGVTRPGQQLMARAVGDAAAGGEHLLVQAGTGTGKSLAYLVPALLVDGPVVVSTATLALQSQLVDHDLPRLSEAAHPLLGRQPTFAVLKGRHHYLCLARLDGTSADEPADALFETEGASGRGSASGTGGKVVWLGEAGRLGKQMQRLRDWAAETSTGDRDELDPGVDDSAWRLVSMPARECVGAARCPYGMDCFAEASRTRARQADVVVTNHSLLAYDMLAGRHIIPPHRLLIVDEAHELADRVSSAAQAEISPEIIDRAARRARAHVNPDGYERLVEAGDSLSVGLAGAAPGRITGGLAVPVRRGVDPAGRRHPARAGRYRRGQGRRPRPGTQAAGQSRAHRTVPYRAAAARAARITTWPGSTRTTAAGPSWSRRYPSPPLSAPTCTPNARSWPRRRRSRSAASSTPSPKRSGLPAKSSADEPAVTPSWRSLDVGSPFDYPKQGILYVAARLPRPDPSGLSDAGRRRAGRAGQRAGWAYPRAVLLTPGGRTRGRGAARAHQPDRAAPGRPALPLLIRAFRDNPATCLMGVMSLWQGVDVPGDACQLVVIDRLPFPRPDEPLAAARSAAVDAAGGSGFAAVSVPIAAVRLAQGVGRLIRSADRPWRGRGARLPAGDRPRVRRLPAGVAAAVLVHHQPGGRTRRAAPARTTSNPDLVVVSRRRRRRWIGLVAR